METKKTSLDGRLLFGLLLIVAGFLLLLDAYNIWDFNLRYYLISWKTMLIAMGLIFALNDRENPGTGIVLITIGVAFWLPAFFNINTRMLVLPVVLIGGGLLILSRSTRKSPDKKNRKQRFFDENQKIVSEDDFIDETAVFGGGTIKSTSSDFKGGKITAIFGGSEINLSAASPAEHGSNIDLLVLFGGITLIVPEDWQVKSETLSIFGGTTDKRIVTISNDTDKVLVIKGTVMFGGIEIKSF